jgi:hypothetical protein
VELIKFIALKKEFLHIFLLLMLGISFCFSCKKENTEAPVDVGYEYYPVTVGNWIIYQVDSIVYDDFSGTTDTFNYQIKEVIESDFTDNEGRNTQRLERYKRQNDTSQWVIQDVWYSNRNSSTAEKVEENVRFLKMVFPIKSRQEWNGNMFNFMEPQTYKYESLFSPYDAGSMHFDSTVTVLQMEELNLILDDYAIEVFAKNIGMVYKKFRHLEKEPDGTIIKGLDLTYIIRSHNP